MKIMDTALFRVGLAFWARFALLVAVDASLLPARFHGQGMFFRWQVWLLAGIFTVALRSLLRSTRCGECHEWKAPALKGLFTMGEVLCRPCLKPRECSAAKSEERLLAAEARFLL
jgi:hypothetical protein